MGDYKPVAELAYRESPAMLNHTIMMPI